MPDQVTNGIILTPTNLLKIPMPSIIESRSTPGDEGEKELQEINGTSFDPEYPYSESSHTIYDPEGEPINDQTRLSDEDLQGGV